MDGAGISHMVLMGWNPNNDTLTKSIYDQYPNRIVPVLSAMYAASQERLSEKMLPYVENQLAKGVFKGVGEVLLRYYAGYAGHVNEPQWNEPADSPLMKKLSDIVIKHDAVMIIHMEPELDCIKSLQNLLDYNKELKLVWAHFGSMDRKVVPPSQSKIGEIMDTYPNVYADISGIEPGDLCPKGGARRCSITDAHWDLPPEFKKLLQDHSDRVLFGLDTPWQENWDQGSCTFPKWVEWGQYVAGQLNDAGVAEAVMHKNAERLFKISS
jgi:predicted TIM-barrel fold metal-dependent hydrolase